MLPRYPGARKQRTANLQKAQNMPDFHVLLSLIYPQDDSPSAPMIAGGLTFEYLSLCASTSRGDQILMIIGITQARIVGC